jgi:cysteine synthase
VSPIPVDTLRRWIALDIYFLRSSMLAWLAELRIIRATNVIDSTLDSIEDPRLRLEAAKFVLTKDPQSRYYDRIMNTGKASQVPMQVQLNFEIPENVQKVATDTANVIDGQEVSQVRAED